MRFTNHHEVCYNEAVWQKRTCNQEIREDKQGNSPKKTTAQCPEQIVPYLKTKAVGLRATARCSAIAAVTADWLDL